jgi:hypothetical protein
VEHYPNVGFTKCKVIKRVVNLFEDTGSSVCKLPHCRSEIIVIFTLTLAQKFETSNLKLSLINSLSFIQSITYTK